MQDPSITAGLCIRFQPEQLMGFAEFVHVLMARANKKCSVVAHPGRVWCGEGATVACHGSFEDFAAVRLHACAHYRNVILSSMTKQLI